MAAVSLRYRWSVVWFLGRLGALSLSNIEAVLVFAGIPALVVLAVYTAVYGTSARRVSKRYRPGRPFVFAPVWFLAGADDMGTDGSTARALGAREPAPALPAGPVLAQAPDASAAAQGETGGASDSW